MIREIDINPSAMDNWINHWIGTPHVYDGRTVHGIDCYGLVVRFYSDIYHINLPDWRRESNGRKWITEVMISEKKRLWRPIDLPANPSIALIEREQDRPNHMGIHWRGYIIHSAEKVGVRADPLSLFKSIYGDPVYGYIDIGDHE